MKVGIVAAYQKRHGGYVTVQLARYLATMADVAVLALPGSMSTLSSCVDPWVKHAENYSHGAEFSDWYDDTRPDVVVWMRAPSREQVDWLRTRGAMAVLIGTCLEDDKVLSESYPRFDTILAPSSAALAYLSSRGLRNLQLAAWCPMRAATTSSQRMRATGLRQRIHISAGADLRDPILGDRVADMLARLLRLADGSLTLSWWGCEKKVLRRLGRLSRESRGRFRLDRVDDYDAHLAKLPTYDITVYLSKVDPFALGCSTSLFMGVPVIGFEGPPRNEYVNSGVNGELVPHTIEAPTPNARDCDALAQAAVRVCRQQELLARWRGATAEGLNLCHARFAAVWRSLLSCDDINALST